MASSEELIDAPWRTLAALAGTGDAEQIREEFEQLGAREMGRALSRLSNDERQRILELLDNESAARLIEELPDAQVGPILAALAPHDAADIIEEMESAEAADLLDTIADHRAEEIIRVMEPEAAEDARLLGQYDNDVAGGLMVREYLAYPDTRTVGEVLHDLRENADKYRTYDVQYAYVVSAGDVLVGVLPLRDLLLQTSGAPVKSVMKHEPITVEDESPLVDLEEFFDKYPFLAAPVTNHDGKLLGVVTREDVQEAVGERADDMYLKSQGIVGGEELRSMPLMRRSSRRLSWLSINIVLNLIAASVIAYYEDTLASVIALAVFLPIISDMSGCSGNQAVAVTMRELTLGLIKPSDYFYVWIQEIKVGVINGLALGSLIAVLAFVWRGNPYLGVVAGGALALNTAVAVSIGGLVPMVLKRFKMDPALASGPILTTVTDMCGFFFVLSLATVMLPYLT
jgi:magnesium transporter